MLSSGNLIRSGDRSLCAYLEHLAVTSPRGRVASDESYLLFAGGHDNPGTYTNGAIRRSLMVSPAELVARADEFFGEIGRAYVMWVRDHADRDLEALLVRRGCWLRPPAEGNAGFALVNRPAPRPAPPGIVVRRVVEDSGLLDYARVVAAGYQLSGADDDLIESVLFSLDSLRSQRTTVVVAYDGDTPVAGCMTFSAGADVGLQWTATDPGHRGRGLGRRVFERAANAAFDDGARCVTGLASMAGLQLWQSLGAEVVTSYRRYVVPTAAEGCS
jgi:GNAT superfamily N-acetyltransferase